MDDTSTRPRRRWNWWAVGAAVGAAASVGYLAGRPEADPTSLRRAERDAPAFALEDLRAPAETIGLADLAGRPVVLNFWASWCVPCRTEMPAFEAVHQRLGDRVVFVGVNHQDSPTAALQLLEETGITYVTGRDPDGSVAADYGAVGLPATAFISADGELLATRLGEMDEAELEETIDELLFP